MSAVGEYVSVSLVHQALLDAERLMREAEEAMKREAQQKHTEAEMEKYRKEREEAERHAKEEGKYQFYVHLSVSDYSD